MSTVVLEITMSPEEVEILSSRLEDSRIQIQDDFRTINHVAQDDLEIIEEFCRDTNNAVESVD